MSVIVANPSCQRGLFEVGIVYQTFRRAEGCAVCFFESTSMQGKASYLIKYVIISLKVIYIFYLIAVKDRIIKHKAINLS